MIAGAALLILMLAQTQAHAADALHLLRVPRVCIEVVLERAGDGELIAAGYDMGSGSWYRFDSGRLTVFASGRGVLHGAPVAGGGLEPNRNIRSRDASLEEMVFPFVFLSAIVSNPACVQSVTRSENGLVTLVIRAPGGNPAAAPGSAPDQAVKVEIDPPARVRRIVRLDPRVTREPEPLVLVGEVEGVPVHMPVFREMPGGPATWRLVSGTVKPPGSAQRPCFTPESVEQAMLPLRRERDERMHQRRQSVAASEPPPPPRGTAPVEGPVERTPGSRWGPALVVTGAITLLIGGYLWFRNRR
jgi:hypothetical protein